MAIDVNLKITCAFFTSNYRMNPCITRNSTCGENGAIGVTYLKDYFVITYRCAEIIMDTCYIAIYKRAPLPRMGY